VLPLAIERLSGCVEELRQAGNPATLRPETMGKSAMLGSLEDTLQMSQAMPGVLPCLDFAHLHARPGDGSMNTYEEWVILLDTYRKRWVKRRLPVAHPSVRHRIRPKGEKEHLPIEDADLDLPALFKALKVFNCRGRILCESPAMEDDALKLQKLWDEMNAGVKCERPEQAKTRRLDRLHAACAPAAGCAWRRVTTSSREQSSPAGLERA
jgi:deoxyribonuclease-4